MRSVPGSRHLGLLALRKFHKSGIAVLRPSQYVHTVAALLQCSRDPAYIAKRSLK